jgi:hypothetical protein
VCCILPDDEKKRNQKTIRENAGKYKSNRKSKTRRGNNV